MNRSIETRPNLSGHRASRLWIGLIMLGAVLLSQVVASVATGMGSLPQWTAPASAGKDSRRVEARETGVEAPPGQND